MKVLKHDSQLKAENFLIQLLSLDNMPSYTLSQLFDIDATNSQNILLIEKYKLKLASLVEGLMARFNIS